MTDLRETAAEIHEQFSDDLDVTVDDVEERLRTLVDDYKVPVEEARRSVVSSYLDEADMDRDDLAAGGSERVQVADVDAGDQWVDLRVTVVDLWEPGHESISQVGLLGDESGTIRFVAFESSDLPALEEARPTACATWSPTSTRAATR